jgi:hypothetical protein
MKRLACGAAARRADLWALGWLGLSMAVAVVGCSHTATTGGGSATTPAEGAEAAVANPTPVSEPVADPPAERPPGEEPPSTLAEQLNRTGVQIITRNTQRHDDGEGAGTVHALAFGDRQSATFCMTVEDEPRCWGLPFAAPFTTTISFTQEAGGTQARTSFGHPDGGYVSLVALAGAVTLTHKRTGLPDQPLEAPAPRDVPALVEQLDGLELVMSGRTLVARADDEVRICERGDTGFACTGTERLSLLESDGVLSVVSVLADYPGVVGIEYSWREQDGDVYTDGEAIIFVQTTENTLRQLAHVYVGFARTARVRLESEDLEIVEMESFDVEQRQPGCVRLGSPTMRRTLDREDGSTRTLRPPVLRRAPDTVPPDGLDPLTFNMAGSWAFEPTGGLRRIASCDYEDEEDEEDYEDYEEADQEKRGRPLPTAAVSAPSLAELLNGAGIIGIARAERTLLDRGFTTHLGALAFTDGHTATFCMTQEQDTHCWALPEAASGVGAISLLPGSAYVSVWLQGGGFLSLTARSGTLTVTQTGRAGRPRPYDRHTERDVPALVQQLAGFELLTDDGTLVVRASEGMRVCRRSDAGFACTEPAALGPLPPGSALRMLQEDFPGVLGIQYAWDEQRPGVSTSGSAILFVATTSTAVTQLAHVHLGLTRVAGVGFGDQNTETTEFERLAVDHQQAGCLSLGRATLRQTVERANGSRQTLRPAAPTRAPDTVPATGVDPLTVDMAGAWAFEPAGGLRRIPRCVRARGR